MFPSKPSLEHAVWLGALILTFIVLVYCSASYVGLGNRISDHVAYIHARDARWEDQRKEIGDHLTRQDADARNIQEHQEAILKNQQVILDRLKASSK